MEDDQDIAIVGRVGLRNEDILEATAEEERKDCFGSNLIPGEASREESGDNDAIRGNNTMWVF